MEDNITSSFNNFNDINELLMINNSINSVNSKNSINSENQLNDKLFTINKENINKYEEIKKSFNLINDIFIELRDKQKLYYDNILYLESIQNDINKLFLELSKKKYK